MVCFVLEILSYHVCIVLYFYVFVDVNECLKNNDCADDANCHNTPGSYKCTCKKGYHGNGRKCQGL